MSNTPITGKKKSRIWFIPRSELEDLVKKSKFMTDLLKSLNFSSRGASYRTMKSRLDFENIDYSHFKKNANNMAKDRKDWSWARQISNDVMFGFDTNHSTATLKRRILADNLIEQKCAICRCGCEWRGEFLSLQLDHVNGDIKDNRLENLRFACPNCHSQTSTFAGRKHKKIRQKITSEQRSARAKEIGYKFRKVIDRPTREVLLAQIQEHGYKWTGEFYGVSDGSIRNWLKD